jgi:sigma-B regulation protein RsbU (phosphoserine phosphatase)
VLAQLLASGVAAALAQKKLVQVERDLEIGRQIQGGFLPKELPQPQGWEVTAYFRPAREVSGDFYDAFALPDGHLALVIADVCDKGVGAALYMTLVRSLLRAFALQAQSREPLSTSDAKSPPPASDTAERQGSNQAQRIAKTAVELTNAYVAENHGWQCMFCTLFFGVLESASGVLTYINAGHDAPALVGPEGIKVRLRPTGPVVGIKPSISYEMKDVLLEPGDSLFAFTDGVTEARDPTGVFFTEKRLLSILAEPVSSTTGLVDNVVDNLLHHIAGALPHDDVTMLAVRRAP